MTALTICACVSSECCLEDKLPIEPEYLLLKNFSNQQLWTKYIFFSVKKGFECFSRPLPISQRTRFFDSLNGSKETFFHSWTKQQLLDFLVFSQKQRTARDYDWHYLLSGEPFWLRKLVKMGYTRVIPSKIWFLCLLNLVSITSTFRTKASCEQFP